MTSSFKFAQGQQDEIHLYEYPYYSSHYSITITDEQDCTVVTPWFDI